MSDDWSSFPRADGKSDNEWDDFPRAKPKRAERDQPPTPARSPPTGDAVDGDTLRTANGPNLRLYGADAPEADQQGWDRAGQSVPIGQRATQGLAHLVTPAAVARDYVGQSYGRPVASVEQDGRDVGQTVIREGNALAAPEYLKGNEQFAPYMEAERLARQNRLGMHGVYAQTPEDYRHAPDDTPDRETVARFWDTPTPESGLRPEIEQGYLAIQRTGSADDILKYAADNGFTIDPDITRKFVKSRDAKRPVAFEVTYDLAPKPLTNQGDGATGAFARGIGDGVLPNMLDEAGAVVDTLGGTNNRENVFNSDRRLADIVANNVDQNRAIIGFDDMEHPYARLSGEVAGGLALPFGAGARSVPELAKVGAAYGAAAGFGGGETIPERLTGAVLNAGAGAVVTAAGGKLLEAGLPKLAAGLRWARGSDGKAVPVSEGSGLAPDAPVSNSVDSVPRPVGNPVRNSVDSPALAQNGLIGATEGVNRAVAMDADAGEVATRELRKPDYLLTDRPTRMDAPLTEAQMRAAGERIAPSDVLERQQSEAGGPIYTDRSVPADQLPPLPPVQAYEDWPADGPDFAGNINLNKLESPQDIKRALAVTEQRVGFDAGTRGRVTQAETERLAAELGMTPDTLLSRRKGQALNAEEALAARQILAKSGNELVNLARKVQQLDEPGDDALAEFRRAWMRHAAIQEQVSGATAEAGRALAQFKMAASSRAVRGDVLSSLLNAGGGRDRIKQAAEVLIDAIEESPGKFNAQAARLAKPMWRDKLVELWINSLLSGPQTHAVNFLSNTMTALGQLPEHAVAAGIGKGRELMMRKRVDRVLGSEVGARAIGLMHGAREGLRLAGQTFRTGESSDLGSRIESQGMKAISGRKGDIIRLPTRALAASDELFKGMARRMELTGLAVRQARQEGLTGDAAQTRIAELIDNPSDDLLQRSLDYGRYLTFQRPLGPGGSKAVGFVQDFPALKLFVPFIRTPTNLLKFAVERSPLAPALREWRKDFAAGGARRDLAVAKSLVGSGVGMLAYELAQQGNITGSGPADDGARALLRADGWQPYSIRIGDKYVSYQRLDPFASTLGIAATLADLGSHMTDKQREKVTTLLVASVLQNMASKTWLSGISSITEAIADPDRYSEGVVERLAGSVVVPTGVAQIARTVDPVQREVDGIVDAIKARVPGLSQSLPPQRDVWGKPVAKEGGLGPDIVSPLWVSTRKNDPVNKALLDAGAHIGKPSKSVGDREMTPDEYGQFRQRSGQLAKDRIGVLVKSDAWKAMTADDRREKVSDTLAKVRKETKAAMFGKPGAQPKGEWDEFPRSGAKAKAPDEWDSFAPRAAQADVVGDLQRLIPGVQFTSGFRDKAYQADMRRRGYHPAEDSAHLDGSSLDILPPPGKSRGWLKAQLKRYRRDVRLLDEGDHVHTTFPDWFGAPVLGGAKGAGLVNPMAGQ